MEDKLKALFDMELFTKRVFRHKINLIAWIICMVLAFISFLAALWLFAFRLLPWPLILPFAVIAFLLGAGHGKE